MTLVHGDNRNLNYNIMKEAKKAKYLIMTALVVAISLFSGCTGGYNMAPVYTESIPASGNSWVMNDLSMNSQVISNKGVANWREAETSISTFFRTSGAGNVDIAIIARVISGKSTLEFSLGDKVRKVRLTNTEADTINIGSFFLSDSGYYALNMKGVSRTDTVFAEVTEILIGGEGLGEKVNYLKDDFYFGRRGPSVHLRYKVPEEAGNITLFYNEVTIPEGNDVPGSFFMANGFSFGYFGIQVNSDKERRILFSVWSPYRTDNPDEIPPEYRILLLDKGPDVEAGSFGNEGSGGQSYLRYFWNAGTTYRFLLKGEQNVKGSTDFSAYFFAPEIGEWQLIASFRRPMTEAWLTGLHSFLENFRTETGPVTRQGLYSSQWVCNTGGEWYELTEATFTADATARKDARLDYAGGVDGESFFLKNCGFFDAFTPINSTFSRKANGKEPQAPVNW